MPSGITSRYRPSAWTTRPSSSSSASAPAIRPASSAVRCTKLVDRSRGIGEHSTDAFETLLERCAQSDGPRRQPERREDVADTRDRGRSEPEEVVRATRERTRDLAGHREHLAALVECEVCRDQRPAPLARLDDDGRVGRGPATIRLRAGKRHGAGSTPGAYSETIRPRRAISRGELGVRPGIVAVDAAPEHGDRCAPPLRSSAPRCAAASTPRARPETTTTPAAASSRAELVRDGRAVGGARSSPDDRHRRSRRAEVERARARGRRARAADRGSSRQLRRRERGRSDRGASPRDSRSSAARASPTIRRLVEATRRKAVEATARAARRATWLAGLRRRTARRAAQARSLAELRGARDTRAPRARCSALDRICSRPARRSSSRPARRVRGRGPTAAARSTARVSRTLSAVAE